MIEARSLFCVSLLVIAWSPASALQDVCASLEDPSCTPMDEEISLLQVRVELQPFVEEIDKSVIVVPAIARSAPVLGANVGQLAPPKLELLEQASSSGMLTSWEQAFKEDPNLFQGCSKVFVDVGSNRGTHVRKLFEPEKYLGCPYLAVFNDSFGTSRSRPFSETGICAFGFEANPRWTSTLHEIEKAYAAQGWRAKWFAPAAVSNETGSIEFFLESNHSHSDWGASVVKQGESSVSVKVPALDLSSFMQQLKEHSSPGYKLMKMDIEKAEYVVLPALLQKNLLCEGSLDKLTIEWHEVSEDEVGANRTRLQVEDTTKCGRHRATIVSELDDESYLEDGMPLPVHTMGK